MFYTFRILCRNLPWFGTIAAFSKSNIRTPKPNFCNSGHFFFYLQAAVQQFCLLHQPTLLVRVYACVKLTQFPALTQMHQHLCAVAPACGPLSPISARPSDCQSGGREQSGTSVASHVLWDLDLSIINVLRWHSLSAFSFYLFLSFPIFKYYM